MMTEEQARETLCHRTLFARSADFHEGPPSEIVGTDGSDCIGSRCMAWRWALLLKGGRMLTAATKEEAERLAAPDSEFPEKGPTGIVGGYCGAAGAPR